MVDGIACCCAAALSKSGHVAERLSSCGSRLYYVGTVEDAGDAAERRSVDDIVRRSAAAARRCGHAPKCRAVNSIAHLSAAAASECGRAAEHLPSGGNKVNSIRTVADARAAAERRIVDGIARLNTETASEC